MKKIFKAISLLTLFLGFFYLTQGTVSADDFENSIQVQAPLTMEVGESVSQTVVDDEFGQGTITVTKVAEDSVMYPAWTYVHAETARNGTFHINYVRGVYNCGFYITIQNNKITRAYDLWYAHVIGVTSASLTRDNDRTATAYFQFQAAIPFVNGPSWNGALRATTSERVAGNYMLTTYVR